jgi:hypothetical protein
VRVKIVISDRRTAEWRLLARLAYFGARAWDEIAKWSVLAIRQVHQALCGLSGHQDVLQLQRQRIALSCARCGRRTRGWDLTDPTPRPTRSDAPRYLELARRRS